MCLQIHWIQKKRKRKENRRIITQIDSTSFSLRCRTSTDESTGTILGGQLLKEHLTTSPPNMSPFFLRHYIKGHAGDVFEPYPQLLTEMVLRLPQQVHKHAENTSAQPAFEQPWYFYLCEYMMSYQTPCVRRQVRKLLLFICGNKEKYRQLRDLHALISHAQVSNDKSLTYETFVRLFELHLHRCTFSSSRCNSAAPPAVSIPPIRVHTLLTCLTIL